MKRGNLSIVVLMAAIAVPALAEHPCTSPLVLDLEGDGIHTTGLDYPVMFDINSDNQLDRIGWTAWTSLEAFLWLDRNRNDEVDHGGELFGSSTVLSTGKYAANGFEALAEYDLVEMGGNADGVITRDDSIWPFLELWIDLDHDGRADSGEVRSLDAARVESLSLVYTETSETDGAGNKHRFQGSFLRRIESPLGGEVTRKNDMIDIFFLAIDDHAEHKHG